ncbi:MAG: hypothetical protein ABIH92_01295 [Nanoarchaeota archaeon]
MKRLVIASLIGMVLFCMFSLSFVAGWEKICDDDNQTLFKLASSTNSHVELWNGTSYTGEDVCFNHIFYGSFLGPVFHECDGTNTVFRFSAETNAHGELKDEETLSYFDVCYGDLNCTVITSGNCSQLEGGPQGEGIRWSRIVSLSSDSNAHISFGDVYDNIICCRSTSGIDSRCDYDGICEPGQGETEEYCIDCRSVCGDGEITGMEVCDVNVSAGSEDDVLGGETCASVSEGLYLSGNLSCMEGCLGFDFLECIGPECGDGFINGSEECEPPGVLNNKTCELPGGYDGWQWCDTVTCRWTDCTGDSGSGNCGDEIVNGDEDCDCGNNGICTDEELNGKDCEEVDEGFRGGNLSCFDDCTFNTTQCIGSAGFCQDYQPFFYQIEGIDFAPSNCYEYNFVYNESGEAWEREELCLQDCVPGASDPVSNGYAGAPLSDWGCDYDDTDDDPFDGGECYFSFTMSDGTECRIDYTVLEECTPDSAFRTVEVHATRISGDGVCDAGCGSDTCTTQIPCPKVIQLPFFGILSFVLSLIAIGIVYIYYLTKKK